MGHKLRIDVPGAIFHVVNRGLARRALFDVESERRVFLSLVARAVRKGWIRVHAYVLMTNHFHLLVTSEGHLSTFMQWAMSQFVRRFNRGRERDGALFRGRFKARRVLGEVDFCNVVRYIDSNPVVAGLVSHAAKYPACSAWHYANHRRRPLWLHREAVERLVVNLAGQQQFEPRDYSVALQPASESVSWWVERHVDFAPPDDSDTSRAASATLREWRRRQTNADGLARYSPLVAPVDVLAAIGRRQGNDDDRRSAMSCGLLRLACGLSIREICGYTGLSSSRVRTRCNRHAELHATNADYARDAGNVVREALGAIGSQESV